LYGYPLGCHPNFFSFLQVRADGFAPFGLSLAPDALLAPKRCDWFTSVTTPVRFSLRGGFGVCCWCLCITVSVVKLGWEELASWENPRVLLSNKNFSCLISHRGRLWRVGGVPSGLRPASVVHIRECRDWPVVSISLVSFVPLSGWVGETRAFAALCSSRR
jgi:hypothetical protein